MNPKYVFYQALLWDRFARLSPFLIATSIVIFYLLGYRNWELLIDTILVFTFLFFVTWWFWVVWTIMLIASVLEKSKVNLQDIIKEVKNFREEMKDLNN